MRRGLPFALAACCAALATGCGGDDARQDADEPEGTWTVDVVEAEFPRRQKLAQPAELTITVRNEEDRAIPNLAVTVDSFSARSGALAWARRNTTRVRAHELLAAVGHPVPEGEAG